MSPAKQQYQDVNPVTLHIVEEKVTSSLYCGSVDGISAPGAGLVEAFLVEVYRCRVCRFTSGLKSSISSHLLENHHLGSLSPGPALPCLDKDATDSLGGMAVGDREDQLDQTGSPYNLELNAESKHSDDDSMDHMGLERMPFLLPMYGMLPNISPRSCEMGLGSNPDGSLHVAQTCEVSTLFEEEEEDDDEEDEEESTIFPLKGSPVDLSCPITPPATQEEMAQSAHLMTLGLCRISTTRPLSAAAQPNPHCPAPDSPQPPLFDNLKENRVAGGQQGAALRKQTLLCLLCPLTLPSRQLLDVHVRSHQAEGGFSCPQCGWRADGWEEMELHWRNHWRRRRRRRRKRRMKEEEKKKAKKVSRPFSCQVCLRTFRSDTSRNAHQHKHNGCVQGIHCNYRDRSRVRHKGCGGNQSDHPPSRLGSKTSRTQSSFLDTSVGAAAWCQSRNRGMKKKSGRKDEEEKEGEEKPSAASREKTDFCCLLCNRKFSTKLTLRRHMGIHQGQKPYDCPHCQYSTRLKASLVQHIRIHTGEKPYRCSQCPYASIDSSSLRRHCRTHTQEKPYRCQYCSYSSIQKKSLDLHARRHHTGEAFPCQLCQYSSPDRQLLLRHIRKHHASSQHAAGCQQRSTPAPDNIKITGVIGGCYLAIFRAVQRAGRKVEELDCGKPTRHTNGFAVSGEWPKLL